MQKLLLGVAALSLSGCSFFGYGGHGAHDGYYAAPGHYGAAPAPQPCGTPSCLSRFNLEGGIGPSFTVGGTAVTGDQAHDGNGANIRNISMNDAYDTGLRAELGASYAASPNTKVTAMAFQDKANSAGTLDWGTLNGGRLTGGLSDYKSSGVELGLRRYFSPQRAAIVRSVRPYIEGRVGAAYQDSVYIEDLRLDGAQVGTGRVNFTESGWVPTAAGLVGIETPLTRYSTIGVETGIRYTGAPDSNTSTFSGGNPLAGINNGGERISVPLMLRGRYRF